MESPFAALLYFTVAGAYMAWVLRERFAGQRKSPVLAMALAWLLLFGGLAWAADLMGWSLR